MAASNGHADVAKLLMDMGAKKALWGGRFLHGARLELTLFLQALGDPAAEA